MIDYVQPNILKLGQIPHPFALRIPRLEPPPGSAIDQDTTKVEADTAILVAGGEDGDPSKKQYLSQSLYNNRSPVTGFGFIIRYKGNVTEPLIAVISDKQYDPHDGPGDAKHRGTIVYPEDLEEGSVYYIWTTFENNPLTIPANKTMYLILATNQNFVSPDEVYWAWYGSSQNPYDRGKIMVFPDSASGWQDGGGGQYDGLFMTYTEGDPAPCSSHTTQSNCVNAGCYWYDNSCHDSPPTEPTDCSQYTTQATCEAAGCHWYQKYFWEQPSCHDKEQDMIMDYLPFILVGAGGVILIAALAMGRKKPQYYAPPPPHPGYA